MSIENVIIKNFKKFNDKSDIDVGIISNYYFDIAWHELRNQKYYKLDNHIMIGKE